MLPLSRSSLNRRCLSLNRCSTLTINTTKEKGCEINGLPRSSKNGERDWHAILQQHVLSNVASSEIWGSFTRVGILAFHKALTDQPREASAVAAFSLAVHNGGNLLEAVDIARRINKQHNARFPELLDPSGLDAEYLEEEILDLADSVKGTLSQMTTRYLVAQAMADYP
ncbi:hypothetical protein Ahy_A08g037805 [Arachis hypogaea]|uniref:Uncharacterized protein n=1 Tax=Arachis hypogaea TaxID=3818 RepID=A0A445BRZ3_ARAHY|nr:hypothetical protein Ahy_A08g037805 [Arachis hypogaea]